MEQMRTTDMLVQVIEYRSKYIQTLQDYNSTINSQVDLYNAQLSLAVDQFMTSIKDKVFNERQELLDAILMHSVQDTDTLTNDELLSCIRFVLKATLLETTEWTFNKIYSSDMLNVFFMKERLHQLKFAREAFYRQLEGASALKETYETLQKNPTNIEYTPHEIIERIEIDYKFGKGNGTSDLFGVLDPFLYTLKAISFTKYEQSQPQSLLEIMKTYNPFIETAHKELCSMAM